MNKNELKDGIKITGKVRLTVWDAETGELIPEDCRESKNLIISYTDIADVLIGNSQISYCAVGSGLTTPTINDTKLETQIGDRKVVTAAARDGAVCVFSTFFSGAENNGTWNESSLSLTATGTILNRALFSVPFQKTSGKQCQNDWLIMVSSI